MCSAPYVRLHMLHYCCPRSSLLQPHACSLMCCPAGLTEEQPSCVRAVVGGCMHAFCRDCLEAWLAVKPICPLCKVSHTAQQSPSPALDLCSHIP